MNSVTISIFKSLGSPIPGTLAVSTSEPPRFTTMRGTRLRNDCSGYRYGAGAGGLIGRGQIGVDSLLHLNRLHSRLILGFELRTDRRFMNQEGGTSEGSAGPISTQLALPTSHCRERRLFIPWRPPGEVRPLRDAKCRGTHQETWWVLLLFRDGYDSLRSLLQWVDMDVIFKSFALADASFYSCFRGAGSMLVGRDASTIDS